MKEASTIVIKVVLYSFLLQFSTKSWYLLVFHFVASMKLVSKQIVSSIRIATFSDSLHTTRFGRMSDAAMEVGKV